MNCLKFLKLLLVGLLLISTADTPAKSINLVLVENPNLKFSNLDAAILDDHVVFERDINGAKSIWSYNRETKTLVDLNIHGALAITLFKNQAVITSEDTESMKKVHVSDGTINGTTQLLVSSNQLNTRITSHALYVSDSRSRLIRYDGQQSQNYNPGHSLFINSNGSFDVCEFGAERFSVLTSRFFGGQNPRTTIHLFGNYEIVDSFVPVYRSTDAYLTNLNNQCFLSTQDYTYESPRRYSAVHNATGTTEYFYYDELLNRLSALAVVDGRLFGVESLEEDTSFFIHQLNPESMESVNRVEVALPPGLSVDPLNPATLKSTADGLLFAYHELLLFDSDLNPQPLEQSLLNGTFYVERDTQVIQSGENTLLANRFPLAYLNGITKQRPDMAFLTDQKFKARFTSTNQIRIDRIHPNPTNQPISLTGYNFNTKKHGYYQIGDQPNISQLINGAWYNESLSGQGLSISKGIRQDQSEYVFVTAYLFRDGDPLWLAGDANLNGSQVSLNIDLYEYDGPQIFEPNQNANRTYFGQLELELIDCHELRADIQTDNQLHQLTLNRADNTLYKGWCQ